MRKLWHWYISSIRANWKSYRRKRGGSWYLVMGEEVSGFASPLSEWTQVKPVDEVVLAEEHY